MPKAVSKRQARFFGAVAGGKARKKTSMTKKEARTRLRGVKYSKLPERKRKKRKR
jgi:hypothetical protein